jgi:hypothetical protein
MRLESPEIRVYMSIDGLEVLPTVLARRRGD